MNGVTIPTIVGLACINPCFRRELFKIDDPDPERRGMKLDKFLVNWGIHLTPPEKYWLMRLTAEFAPVVVTREQFEAQGGIDGVAGQRRAPADDVRLQDLGARLGNAVRASGWQDGIWTPEQLTVLLERLLVHSPGSLEGAFTVWHNMLCPMWPCDPIEVP